MRCLVPIHQEIAYENSLKLSQRMCDEITLLYVVDKRVVEKLRDESSYILPNSALDDMEKFIIDMQREEARRLAKRVGEKANLLFMVESFQSALSTAIVRENPDILLTDEFGKFLLSVAVPSFVVRKTEVERISYIVGDVIHIRRVKSNLQFLQDLAERLGATLAMVPENDEVRMALGNVGEISEEIEGIVAVERKHALRYRSWRDGLIILRGKN